MPEVFVSYVQSDTLAVERLVSQLKAFDISVWHDKSSLTPGSRWQDAIRRAIINGDFFIACFSNEYLHRSKTYMNEELILAIEELRLRPTDASWFIPVKLSPCDIPDRSIGAGESLRSIQWVDLYSDWKRGINQIITVIQPGISKLKEVTNKLKSKSRREQFRAIDQLSNMGTLAADALPEIVDFLESNIDQVSVKQAVELIAEIGSTNERVLKILGKLMIVGNNYDGVAAAEALAKFGNAALPYFEDVLENWQRSGTGRAMWGLSRLYSEEAVALITKYLDSPGIDRENALGTIKNMQREIRKNYYLNKQKSR